MPKMSQESQVNLNFADYDKEVVSLATVHISQALLETQITKEET